MQIRKVTRTFSVGFELYDLGDKGQIRKGDFQKKTFELLLKSIDPNFPFNKVISNKNINKCDSENGPDVFTFFRKNQESNNDYKETIEYLVRLAGEKQNKLTKKGRNGFINIGIDHIPNLALYECNVKCQKERKKTKENGDEPCVEDKPCIHVRISSVLHLDIENFYKYDRRRNKYVINYKAQPKNIASFSFILESNDKNCEEKLSSLKLDKVYVDLNPKQSSKNDLFDKTLTTINGSLDRRIEGSKEKIGKWNFCTCEREKENNDDIYTKINLRTFLLFYIWASFLGDFRISIQQQRSLNSIIQEISKILKGENEFNKNKYIEPCRFVNSINDLIKYLSFESISISFEKSSVNGSPWYKELLADSNIALGSHYPISYHFQNEWINFLSEVFQRKKDELWASEIFKRKIKEIIRRDFEGAMYFRNIRLYPSYIDSYSMGDFCSNPNLRWDVAWGILLGDILCTMAQTFITYNNKVEKHMSHRKRIKIMFNLLKQASYDLKDFYDADILQDLELRATLEIAKETFLINSHYDKITERIKLFSDYEIEESEQKLNSLILAGGSTANVILAATLDLLLWVYNYHSLSLIAIIVECLVAIPIPAYYIYMEWCNK